MGDLEATKAYASDLDVETRLLAERLLSKVGMTAVERAHGRVTVHVRDGRAATATVSERHRPNALWRLDADAQRGRRAPPDVAELAQRLVERAGVAEADEGVVELEVAQGGLVAVWTHRTQGIR